MKEKLQFLMEQLQLKPSQFARILEINPAIISHILAERNKPGVDLLQKILSKFPQVSPDWLLLNSGEMFRNLSQDESSTNPLSAQQQNKISISETDHTLFTSETKAINRGSLQSDIKTTKQPENIDAALNSITRSWENKTVIRVVLFYADKTFESFVLNNSD